MFLSKEEVKQFKKEGKIVFGVKDVQRLIDKSPLTDNILVFIVHNNEIEAINKHVVGLCRQKSIRHLILPKFTIQPLT